MSPWYSGTEREHQRTFKNLIDSGDIVIDVGANWGLHTLYLSELVGSDGCVIAVEPFPPAFAELEWHLLANNCSNVKAVSVAIGDASGQASFAPGESASTGSLLEYAPNSLSPKEKIAVSIRELDSIVEDFEIGKLKLVKIDVEGAETKVLSGSRKTMERYHPYFVIDLHTPEQDVSVASLLTSAGYRLSRLSGPPIQRTDTGWPDPDGVWGSILASPAI
jgi:FkbM family methyltransferase